MDAAGVAFRLEFCKKADRLNKIAGIEEMRPCVQHVFCRFQDLTLFCWTSGAAGKMKSPIVDVSARLRRRLMVYGRGRGHSVAIVS